VFFGTYGLEFWVPYADWVLTAMTYERYLEYLKACRAPDAAALDRRQEELLHQIEFCVEMRRMWNGAPKA
jgi:hypothetical protein